MSTFEHYWRTRPWLIIAIGCTLIYIFIIVYWMVPAGIELLQKRTLLSRQQTQLDQAQTLASTERLMRARIQHLQNYLQDGHAEGPPADGLDGMLTPLDVAAKKAKLTVMALTAGQMIIEDTQTAWPLEIRATGRYHQIGQFIDQLERGRALMVINKLDLTAPSMKQADITLQLDLTRYQFQTSQESP